MRKVSPTTRPPQHARSAVAEAMAARPLGTVARNYSPWGFRSSPGGDNPLYDPDTGEIFNHQGGFLVPTPQEARANRWALKSVVNSILPGSRTSACMRLRAPAPGGSLSEIRIMKGIHQKAFYQGTIVCGRVWHCPVCAAKVSERRRVELKAALQQARAMGMRIHFVTLTVPHGAGDNVQELLARLSDALKRLSQGKYAIKRSIEKDLPCEVLHGYIRALEVTHGQNGFHPHFHLILFTSPGIDPLFLEGAYRSAWQRACRLSGLPVPSWEHGVTVQDGSKAAEYASKWGLEDEMTKAHMKQTRRKGTTPWGLLRAVLDEDDPDYPPERATALFRVYAEAFAGRRQLFWSVGLRKLLQISEELSDEELANKAEDEQASVLATLTSIQWKAIRRFKQEAHILTVAESNPEMLEVAILWLVTKAAVLVAPDGAPGGGVSRNRTKSGQPK